MAEPLRAGFRGGNARLVYLIERYGEAIHADLTFRGIEFIDWWQSRRWWELLNLIDHLPRDSRYQEALSSDRELAEKLAFDDDVESPAAPPLSEFSRQVELLADVRDLLQLLRGDIAARAGQKPPAFDPTPRPVSELQSARGRMRREALTLFNDLLVDGR
jgi:hypothetical protein